MIWIQKLRTDGLFSQKIKGSTRKKWNSRVNKTLKSPGKIFVDGLTRKSYDSLSTKKLINHEEWGPISKQGKTRKICFTNEFFVVWLCPRDFSFVHSIIHICYHSYVVCLKPNVLIRGYDFCWNNVCSVLSKALYLISWDILNGCGANKRKERNSILFVRLLCNVTWESRLHKKKIMVVSLEKSKNFETIAEELVVKEP